MSAILVVDDSKVVRVTLKEFLAPNGYSVVTAEDGLKAWKLLEKEPKKYKAVLLDRDMPEMNGMELLALIKKNKNMDSLPVVMQTCRSKEEDIREGLRAGAYYYLTKPYDKETLLAVVNAAVADYEKYAKLREESHKKTASILLMTKGHYVFRTIAEADMLSSLLSQACPDPRKAVIGLSELLINAIEHGNLGITYEEKSALNDKREWESEVNRRLKMPQYSSKVGTLEFDKENGKIRFRIKDEGEGFKWSQYIKFSPKRAFDTHGRGIAVANELSFSSLKYLGKGNEVLAIIRID